MAASALARTLHAMELSQHTFEHFNRVNPELIATNLEQLAAALGPALRNADGPTFARLVEIISAMHKTTEQAIRDAELD